MNKRLLAAKKRFSALLNSSKKKVDKWDSEKEYTLVAHENNTKESDIMLHHELFKNIDEKELIEVSFITQKEPKPKLIFQIEKKKCLEKTKANVTICKNILDKVEEKYGFNPTKTGIHILKTTKEKYELKEIGIIFKE